LQRDRAADLTFEQVLKHIDVYGRLAFGGQCVAAMALIAAPVLFVVACILPFVLWDDNRGEAIFYWLGGWVAALAAGGGGLLFAAFCWRWSGDWITEWPGYATGLGIGAVADGVLAYMLTSTPVPIYGSFLITMGAAFVAGVLVAGNLAGTRVLEETRLQRRLIARRR
jgi:hypothetical protein